jgi:hypothetical protein
MVALFDDVKLALNFLQLENGSGRVLFFPGPLGVVVIPLVASGFYRFHKNPNVAKAGGLQSQGGKGKAVVYYREPLIPPKAGQDLEPSGFPEG